MVWDAFKSISVKNLVKLQDRSSDITDLVKLQDKASCASVFRQTFLISKN